MLVLAVVTGSSFAGLPARAAPASAPPAPKWSVVASPSVPTSAPGFLEGVACPTDTSCVATGEGFAPRPDNFQPLAGQSTEASWTFGAAPIPHVSERDRGGVLRAVACPSRARCFAVGQFTDGAHVRTLVERWNGASWAVAAQPRPEGATASELFGIACPAVTTCFAVGDAGFPGALGPTRTFVARWNGKGWSVVPSANGGEAQTDNFLYSVSCATTTSCFAVGYSERKHKIAPMVVQWDGKSWSLDRSPSPSDAISASLAGVSCVTPTSCFAVGRALEPASPTPRYATLIERWNGASWSIAAHPDPSSTTYSALQAVTCATRSSCFAVGTDLSSGQGYSPLIERWNGTVWSVAPGTANEVAKLEAISCRSATSCVAVGGYFGSLIERWDGRTWSVIRSGGSDSALSLVSCSSASSCLAVGTDSATTALAPLAEHWNGSRWGLVSPPEIPTGADSIILAGISCGTTHCFAVGRSSSSGRDTALVEEWDGTSWSIGTLPLPAGASATELGGISCVAATSCVAVGD